MVGQLEIYICPVRSKLAKTNIEKNQKKSSKSCDRV
jgi:hypothetical protein